MTRAHRRTPATSTTITAAGAAVGIGLALALAVPAHAVVRPAAEPSAPSPSATSPWQAIGWSDSAGGTTLNNVMYADDADIMRNAGFTGKGVGIAMIDTGVAPVAGLTGGNVVNGPDLSFDGQDPAKRHIDGNGHGTHLAGIMVGKPSGAFTGGIAPGAKLTSIKVGAANGAVDVSQVIAAVDWVVAHRNDDPANKIRVLELSYGTDSVQSSQLDPLAFAVENAWRAGIVVVAAAGNTGGATRVLSPASDRYVLAVGAVDTMGTSAAGDDRITTFTNRGDSARRVDIVAPGRTILSLRAPGSAIDVAYPAARVGTQLFKGSGTSQAAAVTAASVALLFQARPTLTPDQMKAGIIAKGKAVTSTGSVDNGIKALDTNSVRGVTPTTVKQAWPVSSGKGSLEAARGTIHVSDGGISLTGENDVWGPFSATTWSAASAKGTAWAGGAWMGRDLTGTGFTTGTGGISSWSGRAWSGRAWSGRAWSGQSWSSVAWLGASWS
jgi:serine protease AprX